MKFIWLITILLICLRLCFCFPRCNTSLLSPPAFIQCLTRSHFGGQTEDFHKTTRQTKPRRQSLRPHLKSNSREKRYSNVHVNCSCLLVGRDRAAPAPTDPAGPPACPIHPCFVHIVQGSSRQTQPFTTSHSFAKTQQFST